ncbi:hypothetical protein [Burkholderia sp. KBS0801]|jgi:hypothetical protein|uniref:hypothetical protein n=1 Tax=Burkholderia sp. KBS0801 TaxID=1179675 RepID=UPI00110D843A|nr:hypothetical protein [Burkholderia sp. KBS0801]QDW51055.1 hypothetical protein FFI87_012225 [Burkholderia sp. KBS0801]
MHAVRIAQGLSLVTALLASVAQAGNQPLTGAFVGHGRQCDGQLRVAEKTIEWHTPFANCTKRPYRVIESDLTATTPKIAFLLEGRACGFGVISLTFDPAYPDYWIAKGYRNLDGYKRDSADALSCSMVRLKQ